MRGLLVSMLIVGVVATVAPSVASSDARQADVFRVMQPSAGAGAYFGDCENPVDPPAGTVCHESFVLIFRETHLLDGGSNAPSQSSWQLYATSYTLTFGTPGTEPAFSDQIEGIFIVDPQAVSSDQQHLST